MSKRNKVLIAGASAIALAAGGVGVASATGGDDSERPITGGALAKAEAAALDHLAGGSVTETETGDEESFYEVEVTRDDGSQVDVQLNRDFGVVGQESDGTEDSEEDEAGEE